jgi:hypothetical protein
MPSSREIVAPSAILLIPIVKLAFLNGPGRNDRRFSEVTHSDG